MKVIKALLFLALLLTSYACEKQYTCTCTDDQTGEITNVSTYELSRDNAESACSNANAEAGVSCVLDD
ncbi:MAG: hypothetical protein AAGG68_02110 [Bacteroidota bacterium]